MFYNLTVQVFVLHSCEGAVNAEWHVKVSEQGGQKYNQRTKEPAEGSVELQVAPTQDSELLLLSQLFVLWLSSLGFLITFCKYMVNSFLKTYFFKLKYINKCFLNSLLSSIITSVVEVVWVLCSVMKQTVQERKSFTGEQLKPKIE